MSAECLNGRVITIKYPCSSHLSCPGKQGCTTLICRAGALQCQGWQTRANRRHFGVFFSKYLLSDVTGCCGHWRLAFVLEMAEAGHVLPSEPTSTRRAGRSGLCQTDTKLTPASQRPGSGQPSEDIHSQGGHKALQNPQAKPLIGFFRPRSSSPTSLALLEPPRAAFRLQSPGLFWERLRSFVLLIL